MITESIVGSRSTDTSTPQEDKSILEELYIQPAEKLPIILIDAHTCIQAVVQFLRERSVEVDDIMEAGKSVVSAIARSVLNYTHQISYLQTQSKPDVDFDSAVDTLAYFGIDEELSQRFCLQLHSRVAELIGTYFPGDADEATATRSFEVSYTNYDSTLYISQKAKDVGYNSVHRQNPT